MDVIGFIEGPLWYFSATVFVAGALWRLAGILRFGRKPDLSVPRGSALAGAVRGFFLHFVPHGGFGRRTAFHLFAGYLFHIGLLLLLFWAAPHVAFLEKRVLGFGWEPLPHWGFVVAAEAAFAGLILLWFRRVSDPVLRTISDADDHIGSWLTFIVMLTGCLALQESHAELRALHMLTVELWLIYFPFSRLMHAVTFVFSRSYTGATYGRRGVTP
jgi:nitrate reductase gamma subunit